MSNKDMTPSAKTDIEEWNKTNKCEIKDWTGTKLLDMLWEAPNVCSVYFPDEEVPPLTDKNNPKTIIQQSANLGDRFDLKIQLSVNKETDLNNPNELADILKEELINLKTSNINIKALIYEKVSMFFFSLRRITEALMFLEKSLKITPGNENALLNKGYILEKTDKLDDSTDCYDKILLINPENKLALNNKAHNLGRKGELEEALKLVEKSLKIDPELIVAIRLKTEILKTLNRSDAALDFLGSKHHTLNKSSLLKELKVRLYIDLIDLKAAYELNNDILKDDQDNVAAINNQGVIYEINSKYQHKEKYLQLALEWFEKAISKDKNFPLGWSNKTVALLNINQTEKAERIIYKAHEMFPNNPYVLHKKGVVLMEKKDFRKSLKYFNRASKSSYQEEFLVSLAGVHLALKQWRKAINSVDKILKNNQKNSDVWFIKSEASRNLREPTKAKRFEKKANECLKKPRSLLEDESGQ